MLGLWFFFFYINYFNPVTLAAVPWWDQQLSLQWQVIPSTTLKPEVTNNLPWFRLKSTMKALFKHKQRKDLTAAASEKKPLKQMRSEKTQIGKPCIWGPIGLASVNPTASWENLEHERYWLESISSQACLRGACHKPEQLFSHSRMPAAKWLGTLN